MLYLDSFITIRNKNEKKRAQIVFRVVLRVVVTTELTGFVGE